MNEFTAIVIAVVPLVGVIIGAWLQYFFSRSVELRKHLATLRVHAYTDYVRCLAESAAITTNIATQRQELLGRAADAKTRVCLFGSPKVLKALANFEAVGAKVNSLEGRTAVLALAGAIRAETLSTKSNVPAEDLQAILFGL